MVDAQISIIPDKSLLEREIRDSLSKTYKLTGLNAGSITKPLGEIRGQLGEFEKSLEASNARVVAFGASAGSIYLLSDAIKGLVKSTIDVEKTLADINVILDESDANIKAFGNSLFNVANQTSQTFETAAGAALEFSRQGLGLEETAKRTADALTLAKISGLSAADSVEALTAAVNSFADSGLTTAQIVNKLAAVDAKYAVSSADLAEAIKRVGSSALDAGVNIDQLIGLVTSAQQTTARGGAVIGNSFKTIFTRLQRPKVLDELKEVGITTQTISGQTLPLIQILTQLASTYDSLSSSQKSQVAELVGGVYQINILKAVLGDLSKEYSIYSGALRESSTATNEAEKRVGSLTQTLSSQLNRVTNNLKRAGSVVGELTIAPALETLLGGANAVLEQFALGKEPEDTGDKIAQGVLKGIGKGLAGPGLVIAAAGFFQLFKRLVLFISDASKTLLGLGAAAQKQLAIQSQVLQLLQQNPGLYKAITSGAISSADAATLYLNAVKATNVELERQRVISAQIAASVPKGVVPSTAAAPIPAAPAPRTTPRMRRRASGFIPSFADSGAIAEIQGASQHKGGYKAGTPYVTTIHDGKGGSFKSWVNSAETVTNFTNAAGYKATMVRPPNGFGPGTEIAAAGYAPNFAFKTIQKPYGDILQGVYGAFTVRGSRNPLDPKKFNISWLEKTQKNSKETFEKYIPAFKKDLSSIGVSSLEYVPLSDDKRDSARSRLFNQLIKKHGFSNGYIPSAANLKISRIQLANLLKTKQFQSITYKKSDGSVARYDAAQHRVRRDKLVGASAPAGHKNWTEYDNATGTIVLHTSKQGEGEAKFRRFSIDGIQQLRSGGNTYDVYAKGYIPSDPFAGIKDLLKRTNPIAGENVPAPMYSEVAKGQEILAGEDAKKAAREEKAKLAKQKKMLRDIQRREAASGKLIAGVSRNPFTGKFLSKKDVDLIRKIKAGQESKAAKLAKQAELMALERQTRPGGPIFAKSASELKLETIGAAKYAERRASLSRLASPIFDTSSDPAKQMSAKDLENRLKITTERPPSANSINAQRRRQAEALKAETLKQAEQNRIRNQIRRQQEAAGAIAREAEAGRKAQRAAYAASLQRPKRMGVTRQARLIENLETSQRSRLLPSGPTVSSAGMERAQRKLQERRAREEARDIRRQANAQQTARTQAGMRLAGYYGKGVQPAGVAPTATPAGAAPSAGGGGGRGPRLPVTPPAGGPPNNPPNNGGGTSSAAQERYRRRFGDRAFFKRFGGGQSGGMKSFVGTLLLASAFQNAPEILNQLGVSGIYADEKQNELTAKGQRIQTFGNVGAMASMFVNPAVINSFAKTPGNIMGSTRAGLGKILPGSFLQKPFAGMTKMGETLNKIPGMSKLGNLSKKLPGLGTALTLGMGAYSGVQAKQSGATLEESLMIGLVPAITSLIGSSIGAAIGTFAGGPVGTVAGGVGGFALGEKLGNKIVKSTSRFTVGEERLAKFQENRRLATKFQEESRMYAGSKAATMGLAAEKIRTFDIQKESSESEAEYTRKIKQSSDEYLKLRKDQAAQIIEDIGGINYASKLLSDSGNNIDAFRKQIAKTYMTTGQKEKGGFFTDTRSEEATKRATEQTKLIVKTLKEVEERKAVAPLMRDIGKSLDLFAAKARFISSVVQGFREKDFARGQNLLKNVGGGVEGFLNPEKVGTSFDAIVSSLKVLNDPRLARNSIERGRAAFNLMEGAGQMGIDFTDADRKRLSAMITKGFETQVGQIDIGLSRLGGQFFNDFGLRRGVAQSQFVSGVYQQRNRINTAEAALTGDYRMSMAGYVNPLEAKYGMANDAFIKGIEDTNKAFDLVSRQINTLGEAAQAGAISVKEFASFAEQIRGLTTTANPDNNQEIIAKLNDLIGSLNTRSQQILSQADLNRKTEVSGTVEIKFSENAEGWLQAAKNYSDLTQKDNKLKAGTNSNGTATPTSS